METKRHALFHSFSRKLIAAVLGLSMVMSATVLTASQAPAAAQSGGSTTMLLFDLSSSMNQATADGRTRLEVAQQAMIDAVGGIAPGSQDIGIRSFSDCGVSTLEHAPAPVDAASLALTINSLQIGNLTDISLALSSVAGDFPGSGGRKSVILLSDGEQTCDGDPCETAANLIAAGVDIIVHAIGIGTAGTAAETQLACIATVTGGTVISVDAPDQLFQAIDAAIQGAATTAFVQTAVPTCANSAIVQEDPSLAALTVGSTYTDDVGTTRLLIIGESCSYGCTDGFDMNCDGSLGDFCDSELDPRSVSGIGECLEDLGLDADIEAVTTAGKSPDELLELFCDGDEGPVLEEACSHYETGLLFEERARSANDLFLIDFYQVQADAAFDKARAALAALLPEEDEPAMPDDETITNGQWACPQFWVSRSASRANVFWEEEGSLPVAFYVATVYEVAVTPNAGLADRKRVAGPASIATINPTGPRFVVDRLRAATLYEIDVQAFNNRGTELGDCTFETTTGAFGGGEEEFTGNDVFGPIADRLCARDSYTEVPAADGQEFTSKTFEFSSVLDLGEAEARLYPLDPGERSKLNPDSGRVEGLLDQIRAIEFGAVAPLQQFSFDEPRLHVDGLVNGTPYLLSLQRRSAAGVGPAACYIIVDSRLAKSLSLGGEVRSVAVCSNITFGEIFVVSRSGCVIMRLDTHELRWSETTGTGLGLSAMLVSIGYMTIESDSPDFEAWGGFSSCIEGVIFTEGIGGCFSVRTDNNIDINEFVVRTRATEIGSISWTNNTTTIYDVLGDADQLFERRADAVTFWEIMRLDMCLAFPEHVPSDSWCQLDGPVA